MIKGIASTMNDDWQLNLWKVIKYAAAMHRSREVVSYRDRQGGRIHRLNYDTIYERCCAMANALEEFGIKPGDRVAILSWNDHRCYESFFAVPGIGAVLLPLNLRLHVQELLYILNHSKPKALLFDDSLLSLVETLAKDYKFEFCIMMSDKSIHELSINLNSLYGYEELVRSHSKTYDWQEIDERSAATACYTSGTTGSPKGVYYSHRALMLHRLIGSAAIQKFDLNDVYLQVTPMYHINGHGIYIGATMFGCKIVLPGRFTPESLLDIMINEGVTVACGVATIWKSVLEALRAKKTALKLRVRVETGGVEPPASLIKGLREYGVELIHCWGATETDALAAASLLKPEISSLSEEKQLEYMTKQGCPLFPFEIKLVDVVTGNELSWDGKSVGEIWVKGPFVIREYYNDPRSGEACTADGWWRSGDLATIDEFGYIKIVDQLKDVIKSGGEWISSVDLENYLMTHPAVLEAVVIGVPHPKWEERPLALVVLKPEIDKGLEQSIEKELTAHLLKRFSKWQVPDRFIFVKEIPRTGTGKFAKRELREQYKHAYME